MIRFCDLDLIFKVTRVIKFCEVGGGHMCSSENSV